MQSVVGGLEGGNTMWATSGSVFYGYVVDKVEGFAIDAAGAGFVVTDNDGVDDSSGETLFWSVGAVK